MNGLEYILRVNKYYEDKNNLCESHQSDLNNKSRASESLNKGDISGARQSVRNIKDKAHREYEKQKIDRKKELEKQAAERQKKEEANKQKMEKERQKKLNNSDASDNK